MNDESVSILTLLPKVGEARSHRPARHGGSLGGAPARRQHPGKCAGIALAAALALSSAPPRAEEPAAPAAPAAPADVRLADLPLTDQDGRTVRFASEVIGDHVVAINFIYTRCTTLCPLTSATFKNLQGHLRGEQGKDVRLISLSLDPATDTPARLKAYAARYKAGPNWTWLTGEADAVKQVLTGLNAYAADIQQHPPQVLVGDGRSGRWTRFNTLPGPDRLRATIEQYLKARHE